MQAVILAAGKGTRMRELTASTPKPMLCLLGRPMLAWKIEMLPEAIDEVILVVGIYRSRSETILAKNGRGGKFAMSCRRN